MANYYYSVLVSHPNYDEIQQSINASALEFGLSRVLHQLGVLAGEHNDTVAPLRVAQHAASQQHLLVVQRVALTVPDQRAIEPVQQIVGRLAHDFAVELAEAVVGVGHVGRLHQALFALQVGLAVQFGRLDEAQAVRLAAGQQQNVGSNELIVVHANDVAHLPSHHHKIIDRWCDYVSVCLHRFD